MLKSLMIFSLLLCTGVYAQDMSKTESYDSAYRSMPDGSTMYVGQCSTHEDYKNKFFKTNKVFQKYAEIDSLSDLQIKNLITRFDNDLLVQVLRTLEMLDIPGAQGNLPEIFRRHIDDFFGETINHVNFPGKTFTRVGFGVGGGNGGYMVLAQGRNGARLLSYTFDGDLYFCDKAVWSNKK